MKEQDLQKLREVFPKWGKGITGTVGVVCPSQQEIDLVKRAVPDASVIWITRNGVSTPVPSWDITKGPYPKSLDVAVLCNVMMYISDPETAFRNLLSSCRWLWVQDLVRGRRSSSQYFGEDGDCMRYEYSSLEKSDAPQKFDMNTLKGLVDMQCYDVPGGRSFVALIRGER